MITTESITDTLNHWFPLSYAEPWDPVGVSITGNQTTIHSLMTCLTLTSEVVDEAIALKVPWIITHHPFPFHPIKRFHSTPEAYILKQLISHQIYVYSPHTAYDNAPSGINDQILKHIFHTTTTHSLREKSGKYAHLKKPLSLAEITRKAKELFGCKYLKVSIANDTNNLQSSLDHKALSSITSQRPAAVCGSGSAFIEDLISQHCDLLICGELKYHECLKLKTHHCHIILCGHFFSEKFAMNTLATRIKKHFPSLTVHSSQHDISPTTIIE